jgi:acyl-CoA thioester hydrolase
MNRSHPTNPVAISRTENNDAAVSIDWNALELHTPVPGEAFMLALTIDETHLSPIIPHVTNLEYVRWLEVAASAHAEHRGFDETWYKNNNLIWFVGRHEIDYLAELFVGDEIVIATWVEEMSKYRTNRRYVMFRRGNAKVVCTAMTMWILVSRDRHRPVRIPTPMALAFGMDAISD